MGMSLIYGLLFLSTLMLIGIIMLFFSIKKKSIIGIIICTILIIPIILILLTNTIDELSISKKDVISDLKHLEINLKDNFKIKDNTVTGMPERIQETQIKISKSDKNRIIQLIKNAQNFKYFKADEELSADTFTAQFNLGDKIFNSKYLNIYQREVYKTIDDIPTRIFLTLEESGNEIKYQKIED